MQQRLGWREIGRPMASSVSEGKLYWWSVALRGEGRAHQARRLVRPSDPGDCAKTLSILRSRPLSCDLCHMI